MTAEEKRKKAREYMRIWRKRNRKKYLANANRYYYAHHEELKAKQRLRNKAERDKKTMERQANKHD